jgi:predicted transcriptional regulator
MAGGLDFNEPRIPAITTALAYAGRGWPVFPCNPITKAPLIPKGFKDATTEDFKIRAWWTQWPNAMIGVPTGAASGFWVLDIDQDAERGKTGLQSLHDMDHDLSELMDTAVSQTASGGYHALFRFDPDHPVTNARGSLKRFLDVRGEGGYVVMAGSTRADGRSYAWINDPADCEIEAAPAWLLDAIQSHGSTTNPLDLNTATSLKTPAQRVAAIEPGTWHESTRDIIARMVREGSSDETVAALAPLFTTQGFTVEQTQRELLTHARTAREKWGYQPRDIAVEAQATASRFKIMSIDELTDVTPPEWRIDGIFPTHGSSTIYGAFETFKTFIALDMTLSLASGREWQGRAVKPCSVLYIAGEGQVGLGLRAAGWLAAHGIDRSTVRFHGLPEAIAIPSPGDQDALLYAIDAMPDRPEVIVMDTVTRMTGGGSLNDEKDAQAYVRGMDRIRSITGAHMLNIGHSGKDKERGILGSTVLPAAMETIICVERSGDSLTLINSNPKGKQKDGPNFDDIRLARKVVEFQHQGQTMTTVIMVPDEEVVQERSGERKLGKNQHAVLDAIRSAGGQALGLTRLAIISGLDTGTAAAVLAKLVELGLLNESKDEGRKTWVLQ